MGTTVLEVFSCKLFTHVLYSCIRKGVQMKTSEHKGKMKQGTCDALRTGTAQTPGSFGD